MTDDTKTPIDPKYDGPGAGSYRAKEIKSTRIEVISTADDAVNVTEPSSPAHPEHLYNKVEQTLSGHIREMDDTPGAERISEMHKAGTFYEIHPDGSKVLRVYGKDFYLCLDDHTLFVGGNLNITVQGDANLLVKGNMKQKIAGDYELTVHGNMATRVRGTNVLYSKGDMDIQSKGNLRIRSELKTEFQAKAALDLQSDGSVIMRSDGDARLNSKGRFYIDGSRVDLCLPGTTPQKLNIKDKDPKGGLTVEDSVIEPSLSSLLIIRSDNNELASIDEKGLKYPKDRTEID